MSSLEVSGLTIAYGRTTAVRGIDLTVPEGQVVCLIGANGAGKTSTLRSLSGLVCARSGTIRYDGAEIGGLRPHRIAALGLLQVPEGRQIFADLTVDENLTLGAWLVSDAAEIGRRRERVLARFPRLREPRLLLLDEPSMGLAPLFVEEIFAIVADLRREGTTILLVEQNASAALEVADYAYVLETGKIVLEGPADLVANDPAVISAYLGG